MGSKKSMSMSKMTKLMNLYPKFKIYRHKKRFMNFQMLVAWLITI